MSNVHAAGWSPAALRHVWLLFGIIGAPGAVAARQSLEAGIAQPTVAAMVVTGRDRP